jgi:hypothetical protein
MKKNYVKGDSTEFCGVAYIIFTKIEYKDFFLENFETSYKN